MFAQCPEPVFVNVLRSPGIDSEESIPPAYVAWRAGTTYRGCRTVPSGWDSIPGLLKRFTNTGSVCMGSIWEARVQSVCTEKRGLESHLKIIGIWRLLDEQNSG